MIFVILVVFTNKWNQNFNHWEFLEIIWRVLPAIVLIFLGLPAIKILYQLETFSFYPGITLKIIGHQWYWNYSFSEFLTEIEAFPLGISKWLRLGETKISLRLPLNVNIRAVVRSQDVLHSWAIPSLSLKIDACPGRLNFFIMMITKPGMYVGQCRELCGTYHSFIPIYLETSTMPLFLEWLKIKTE